MTVAQIPGLNLNSMQFGTGGAPPGVPASDMLSNITSQEWSTYLQNFVPEENALISYAMNPNLAAQNMTTAQTNQQQANAQAPGIETRRLQQFDTTLTPEQKKAAELTRGIAGATSTVNAGNQAKDATVANQMGILGASNTGITGSV
jgi:hypothetical protein